jgi:hypothetical protein
VGSLFDGHRVGRLGWEAVRLDTWRVEKVVCKARSGGKCRQRIESTMLTALGKTPRRFNNLWITQCCVKQNKLDIEVRN